jgi:hypothetical protein
MLYEKVGGGGVDRHSGYFGVWTVVKPVPRPVRASCSHYVFGYVYKFDNEGGQVAGMCALAVVCIAAKW